MTDLPIDKGPHPDGPPPGRPGGEGRKWLGRFAWAGLQFVEVAVVGVVGMVVGLTFASWYAMSRAAALRAAPNGGVVGARDFAPDFEPEISIAAIWIKSLVTGGGIGLLVGLVLGVVLARAFAVSRARKKDASGAR